MKKQSTVRGAIYITIGKILSKLIGIFRERLFAVYFGTSYVIDVFKLLVSITGLISTAVISPIVRYASPNITEAYSNEDYNHIRHNIHVILLLAGTVSILASGIITLFPSYVIKIFLPYLVSSPQKMQVATTMTMVMGIMALIYSLIAIFENILIAIHIYTHLGIKDPLINTIWTTIVAIFPYPIFIVWGRLIGATIYLLFVLYLLYKAFSYMKKHFQHREGPSRKHLVKDIIKGTLPMYIGGSVGLIYQFIDRWMAGYLGEGNIALIGYGSVIAGIVSGLLISPFIQSIYPKVSEAIRKQDKKAYLRETHNVAAMVLFFSIPALVGIIAMRYRIAFFFFGSDKMTTYALTTIGTISAIMAYNGILGIFQLFTSAYIPLKRTDIGMKISLVAVPLNIILNYIFGFYLHMGAIGLKVATAIVATFSSLTSMYILGKLIGSLNFGKLLPSLGKTLLASFGMAIFIFPLDKLLPYTRVFTLLITFIGISIYFIIAYIEGHEVLFKIMDKISDTFSV